MEYIAGFLLVVVCILAIMLLRSVTTIFHELGHAIPALIFTKEQVKVYIGSYGDDYKTKSFSLGRLQFFFRLNLMDWKIGMCTHKASTSRWQNIIIILGGPIASILISIPLVIALLNVALPQWLFYLLLCFVFGAIIDFFVNIIPNEYSSIYGRAVYSDGTQLIRELALLSSSKEYLEVLEMVQLEKYQQAIDRCHLLHTQQKMETGIYDLHIRSLVQMNQYDEALEVYQTKRASAKLKNDDYFLVGTIYMKMENYQEAIKYFDHCFVTDGMNPKLLSNMSKCHINLGNYRFALRDAIAAIHNDETLLEPYINKGIALIKLKEYQGAYHCLHFALENDEQDPRIPFYLGLLYEENNKPLVAYEFYQKADELNCKEHGLAYRMEMLRLEIEREY